MWAGTPLIRVQTVGSDLWGDLEPAANNRLDQELSRAVRLLVEKPKVSLSCDRQMLHAATFDTKVHTKIPNCDSAKPKCNNED